MPLGVLTPLTGAGAFDGPRMLKAIHAVASDIDAAGGVLGRKIALHVEDDETNPRLFRIRAHRGRQRDLADQRLRWDRRHPRSMARNTEPAAIQPGVFLHCHCSADCDIALLQRLALSPFGRVLRAIRDDEDVAAAAGKHVLAFK